MTMTVINAVAQFERDLRVERTQAGLARARARGKVLGRPPVLSATQKDRVAALMAQGQAIAAIARPFRSSGPADRPSCVSGRPYPGTKMTIPRQHY